MIEVYPATNWLTPRSNILSQGGHMGNMGWTWADLTRKQLELIAEAERTLGTDYLLAYQAREQAGAGGTRSALNRMQVASLNESQLECLHGLEQQLQAVVVAYKQKA
jgi:hypothetical protein